MSLSTDSKEQEFKILQIEGKQLAAEGKLEESLKKFELAKKIFPTPKVLQRIEKIKEHLKIANTHHVELQSTSLSKDSYSNEINKISPANIVENIFEVPENRINPDVFEEPNVLNDIQNTQKSSAPKSSDLSLQSQFEFLKLKKEAKELAYAGKYEEALKQFKKALCLYDCPKVKRYILEIQSVLCNNCEDVENVEDPLDVKKETNYSLDCIQKSASSDNQELNENDNERKLGKVKALYEDARELAADGKLTDALKVLEEAQHIHKTEKVRKRISKLKELMTGDGFENNKSKAIVEDFSVYHEIYNKLYPYQRDGVAWMWNLYKMGKGGVLADDMGLGKTFQVIAFLSGMIDADLVKHVLIIMPVSLLINWEKEFKKWCPGIAVHDFHGSNKLRKQNLLRVQRRGHVLLTSYGMLLNNISDLTQMDGKEFVWDYVILDEGHKIKNPTKTTKAVYEIPSKNRLVLTGTPIQNNLKELWSLYDFVHQGTLLGSLKTFKLQYENPITRSREKDASAGEKRLGSEISENLKALINPYFLRRTKEEIWRKDNGDVDQLEKQMEAMVISKQNAKKNDFILWTLMSDQQIEIYKSFLHSDAVKSILLSKRSPLVELTILKKICDHPRLLSQRACLQLGLNGELQDEDLIRELEDNSTTASSIDSVSDETLLLESGKLKLVITLLENLKESGHRTLVFSLSRKILDMIHRILTNRNWKVMRLDGTVLKTEERERRIQVFQNNSSYPVFLLTTQVGGVGLTLTAADRVIIYDPSWNPATDAQAVDRVYRIGQDKDVVVYRLITCGSVEEKIYRRQIFKDSITRQTTGDTNPYRYFSKQELRELFSFEDPYYSATQVQLHEMHSSQRNIDDKLRNHITFLESLNIYGISDHDLMFSKSIQDHTEDNNEIAVSENFIKQKVAAAYDLIKMEASVVAEGIRLAGTYNRPYQEVVPLPKKLVKDSSVKEQLKKSESAELPGILQNFPDMDVKGGRQSCARQSAFFVLDSEDLEDSTNSACLSFVPDSASNTPQNSKHLKSYESVCETPPQLTHFEPELQLRNKLDISVKKHESNVRRITPLKINKSLTQENASFVQAMASSIIITPQSSPKESEDILLQPSLRSPVEEPSIVSLNNSPINFCKKKKVRQLCSDSEELEDENIHECSADSLSSKETYRSDKEDLKDHSITGNSIIHSSHEYSPVASKSKEQDSSEKDQYCSSENSETKEEWDSDDRESYSDDYSDSDGSGSLFSQGRNEDDIYISD